VAFVLVGADDLQAQRQVVGIERIQDHSFEQPKIFLGIAGFDRVVFRGELLSVNAGIESLIGSVRFLPIMTSAGICQRLSCR
jgi:hypothetical protein